MRALAIIGRLREKYSNKYTETPSKNKDRYIQWLQDEYAELAISQSKGVNTEQKAYTNNQGLIEAIEGELEMVDECGAEVILDSIKTMIEPIINSKNLSVLEAASMYGRKMKYKWLTLDGEHWWDKEGTVNASFLREMERGTIKEVCFPS